MLALIIQKQCQRQLARIKLKLVCANINSNITKVSKQRKSMSDKISKAELTPEQHFDVLFQQMYHLCHQQGWGDPFSYARSREIHLANHLGHSVSGRYSGSDAQDADGNGVEYKTTIAAKISATYNGISVYPSWEEQAKYLREEKIGKYKWHFYARYEMGRIVEVWKISGEKVLGLLLPKLEKKFNSKSQRKDPRLGATLSCTEITANAEKIWPC